MKKVGLFALISVLFLTVGMVMGPVSAEAKTTFVTIGTGGITGVYYPTGGAIAKMVNKPNGTFTAFAATVESTGGSVFNVNAVMAGDLGIRCGAV
jgi:TRAP-type uncharacterized transport system substrate-binding protein